jgi:hypothetical protein
VIATWASKKIEDSNKETEEVELKLALISDQHTICILNEEEMEILKKLEMTKHKLLKRREAELRIKSGAV